MIFIGMSLCVRSTFSSDFFPPISFAARPTALFIMPHERTMPMTPAMAMPPMPMLLAYSLKIISGDMSFTAVVMAGFHVFRTSSPHIIEKPGTMMNHTATEPAQIMAAYFKPTM